MLCLEHLNLLKNRKIKYAHQQGTDTWSDGKTVNQFYQSQKHCKAYPKLLDNSHLQTVSEL